MSNSSQTAVLLNSIREGRAPHAILLTGSDGIVAGETAKKAAAMYCTGGEDIQRLYSCPDYYEFGPEPVPIDAIRSLKGSIAKKSYSGRCAVVFLEAHNMNKYSQNALLKTLEEPPDNTLFILSGDEGGLFPTIRSRCALMRLGYSTQEDVMQMLIKKGVEPDIAATCAWVSMGAEGLALSYATIEHIEYINKSAQLYFNALNFAAPPYKDLAELLDTGFMAGKEAKSKTALHRPGAVIMHSVFLAIATQMLKSKYNIDEGPDCDIAVRAAGLAQSFTIKELRGMIDKALSAKARLETASPWLALNSFFTDICNI